MNSWLWYSNTGGSLSDGSLWYLESGTTPGTNFGVPSSADFVEMDANGATGFQTLTGSLGVTEFVVDGVGDSLPVASFILAGTGAISTAYAYIYGNLTIQGVFAQTASAMATYLYGGTLKIDGGTYTGSGIFEGVNTGGVFQAVNHAKITLSGGPNSIPSGGLVGLTIKQTGLIDASTVDSSAGSISIGTLEPANASTLTVQDGSTVKALYTFIGSGSTMYGGSLVITGAGTSYSDVGPASTTNGSGGMYVGAYSSTDPQTKTGSTASLTVSNSATLNEAQYAYIGNEQYGVGVATVSTAASWTIGLALRVGQYGNGTLTVTSGGKVQSLGPHTLATSSISFGNNAGSVGAGTVTGAGSLLSTGGDRLTIGNLGTGGLTISAGGEAISGAMYSDVEAALAIGGSAGGAGALVVTGSGSLMQVNGLAVVGGNSTGAGAAIGGSATLTVNLGGRLNATALDLFAGGIVTVATGGIVDLGGTAGAAGALTVEAGSSLTAQGGSVAGAVVDNGLISNGGGTLSFTGSLSGAGTVSVTGTIAVGSTTGGLTYGFLGGHSTLSFASASGGSALIGFGNGDVLDFTGQTVNVSLSGNLLQAGAATFGLYGAPAGTHYVTSSDGAGGTKVTAITAADDFNGDGKSDLLLQNTNGSIVFYGLNGPAVNAAALINNPGPTWHVVGEADFNGDGKPDILLQNDNGTIVDYLMNGTSVTAAYVLNSPGAGWHVRGTADFNGDGRADILLQNDNGSMVLYDTNGSGVTAAYGVGQLPAGWAIEGVGDFNGDGVPDVLVESNTGSLVDYTMNSTGTAFVSGATIANLGPGWTVAGTADYNGDGKADILLHNDNGADVVFTMNGANVTGAISFGNVGAAYQGAVTGIDINGDGVPDLVVQSTDSTLVGFTLGNNAAITAGAVLNVPGAGWNLVGSNPTTFIDGTGSTLALTGTPGPDQFNLTGYAAGLHTIASFDPAQDTVALNLAAFPTYAAVQANEAAYQGGTFINLSPTTAIVIQGVTPAQLTAANFTLR